MLASWPTANRQFFDEVHDEAWIFTAKVHSSVAAASAFAGGSHAVAQRAAESSIRSICPSNGAYEEMLAFYRGLGLQVIENVTSVLSTSGTR